jgi:orotate phosphoribosyltransferase
MNIEHSLATKLLSIKAIKLSPLDPFTWASGLRSPIYCDNRISLAFPEVRNEIIKGFSDIIENMSDSCNSIVGVATAGIPHGAILAHELKLPFAYVRSKAKAHGRQNQIEGLLSEGDKVIVIEDLISTGGSSLQAVEVLEDNGVQVLDVLSIFSYNLAKAEKNFKQANSSYSSLTNYPSLLYTAKKDGYISDSEYATLEQWYIDPKAWSDNFLNSND